MRAQRLHLDVFSKRVFFASRLFCKEAVSGVSKDVRGGEEGVMNQQIILTPSQNLTTFGPTVFRTERNQHEVHCGLCGRVIYVPEDDFSFVSEAIKAGLDDPFRCERCKEEYDDLVYEG